MKNINGKVLKGFETFLREEEKSEATMEKYMHIAKQFRTYSEERPITKELVIDYKNKLTEQYSPRTVNGYIAGVNCLLSYMGLKNYTVKSLKIQRQVYLSEEKELTKKEYLQLLKCAEPKLKLIMETICGTGIRVFELQYFTKEGVERGIISIRLKGKCRDILVNCKLKKRLLAFCRQNGIVTGIIFRNRKGNALCRSSIWAKMKQLCEKAGISENKVYPHNLRKLFARCFYSIDRDIAHLADILGHSSIETTRIYVMSTTKEHRKQIERLGLVQ